MTKRIIFMGTPDFSVPILQSLLTTDYEIVLVVTQPDRPRGRRREITPTPVKRAAMKANVPVFQPESIRKEFEKILEYKPDLIITAAYGQLVPRDILELPPFGCINVHASLLPELRGGAPIHYAILQGKTETGISIMYMDETLDTGDVISQKAIPIAKTDHVGTLHDKLATAGSELLLATLPSIFARTNERIKQVDEQATYAPNISRELEKIDWKQSAKEVYNHIRGLHPWPVAYSTYKGKRMKIWWGVLSEGQDDKHTPGTIVAIDDTSFSVVCGNNKTIAITDIQLSGSRRMKVAEFMRGNPEGILLGEQLE